MRRVDVLVLVGALAVGACGAGESENSGSTHGPNTDEPDASSSTGTGGTSEGGPDGSSATDAASGGSGAASDSSGCVIEPAPDCTQYPASKECAPDWSTALTQFSACRLGTRPYLARCGGYYGIRTPYYDGGVTYYYDASGKLVGAASSEDFSNSRCGSFDSSFDMTLAGDCVPLASLCLPDGGVAFDASVD